MTTAVATDLSTIIAVHTFLQVITLANSGEREKHTQSVLAQVFFLVTKLLHTTHCDEGWQPISIAWSFTIVILDLILFYCTITVPPETLVVPPELDIFPRAVPPGGRTVRPERRRGPRPDEIGDDN